MSEIGDLRVVEFDPDVFEIECYAMHNAKSFWVSQPFWALPNWNYVGIFEFVGPFESEREAQIQIRIFKNNNDTRLNKYLNE